MTATAAYEAAGFKADKTGGAASRLLSGNVRIAERVRYLQTVAAERTGVTIESLTAEIDDALTTARVYGQAGALFSGLRLKAELHGFLKNDGEDGSVGGLPKGITILNGNFVLNRIEFLVVDPPGAGSAGVPAAARARAVEGR